MTIKQILAEQGVSEALDFIYNYIEGEEEKKRQMLYDIASLAIEPAESACRIFEERYPDDKGPREATEAAKNYLSDQCSKNGGNLYDSRNIIDDIGLWGYGKLTQSTLLSMDCAVKAVFGFREFDFFIQKSIQSKKILSKKKVALAISSVEAEKALDKAQNAKKDQRALFAYQASIAAEVERSAQDAIKRSTEYINFLLKEALSESKQIARYSLYAKCNSVYASVALIHKKHSDSCDCEKYIDLAFEKAKDEMIEKQKQIILKYFG